MWQCSDYLRTFFLSPNVSFQLTLIITTVCQTLMFSFFEVKVFYLVSSNSWCCSNFLALLQHGFAHPIPTHPVHKHAVLCLCRLKLTALIHAGCVFRATATPLVPSLLTAMRWASVDASQVWADPNVTAAPEDFSTSRRVAAHVSITSQLVKFKKHLSAIFPLLTVQCLLWSAPFPRVMLKVVATSKPRANICVYIFSNT